MANLAQQFGAEDDGMAMTVRAAGTEQVPQ